MIGGLFCLLLGVYMCWGLSNPDEMHPPLRGGRQYGFVFVLVFLAGVVGRLT